MESKKGEASRQRITKLQQGQNLFTSNGISRVKTTINDEVQCIEIPIKSTGVSELIDSFQKQAPLPPTVDVKATPDSDIGKSLGLTRNEWVRIFDTTDRQYLERKAKHDSDLGLKIMMMGLDVPIVNAAGVVVTNEDEKLVVLKSMGLSGEQFSQIVGDITSLTKWAEGEQTRFFGF